MSSPADEPAQAFSPAAPIVERLVPWAAFMGVILGAAFILDITRSW